MRPLRFVFIHGPRIVDIADGAQIYSSHATYIILTFDVRINYTYILYNARIPYFAILAIMARNYR